MTKTLNDIAYIDLNSISSEFELPIYNLLPSLYEKKKMDGNKFDYEEVKVDDASSSIYFSQHNCKLLLSIYGPRECRFRDKAKNDESIIEIYTKFNLDFSKESKQLFLFLETKRFSDKIQNFCESLILIDQYPRCQINICINIITFENESKVLIYFYFSCLPRF
jgi:ribonuclease PH